VNEVNIEQKNKSYSNSKANGYHKEESEASQFIAFQKWQKSQNLQAPSQQKVPEVKSQVFQKDQS
jgi:maltose-binding protein MalE